MGWISCNWNMKLNNEVIIDLTDLLGIDYCVAASGFVLLSGLGIVITMDTI